MRDAGACPHEPRIVHAVRTGRDEAFLAAHTAECESCRDLVEVLGVMRTLAAEPVEPSRAIPEAGRIWWRGQLVRRWEAERRVAQHVDRMYPVQAGVLALVAILFVIISWPVTGRWMANPDLSGASAVATALLPVGMIAAAIGGALVLTLVTLVVWRDYQTS